MAAHQSWYRERVTAHGLKQRLARWLLMMRDRSDEDELPITQNRQNAGGAGQPSRILFGNSSVKPYERGRREATIHAHDVSAIGNRERPRMESFLAHGRSGAAASRRYPAIAIR